MSGLFFDIDVDDLEVLGVIETLSTKIKYPEPLMRQVGEIVYDAIADAFENEREPGGSPWEKLKESTIKQRTQKGQTPIKKLRATGKGERAISIDVKGDTVIIEYGKDDTGYMRFHRTGTKKMARREFMPSVRWIERSPLIRREIEKYINSIYRLR